MTRDAAWWGQKMENCTRTRPPCSFVDGARSVPRENTTHVGHCDTALMATGSNLTIVTWHDTRAWVAIQLAKIWLEFWLEKRLEISF